jgi:hypothetical protein
MAAKLPASLVRTPLPAYTLGTMPVGSEHDFPPTAMKVDEDLSCYLNPNEKIMDVGFIRVKHSEDGYHVSIRLAADWTAKAIPNDEKAKLIPAETVTILQR